MRLTLKMKVVLLALVPVVLFALVLSGAAAKVLQNLAAQEVEETRERLLQESRSELQHYVQIALGSVQVLYDSAAQGDMASREQAIAILSKIKFGKDGYFFGHDSNVVRLFRGDSPVDVGKNLGDRRDPNGVYINRELVNVAKNNSY
jgi:methyl-accepting chemotaxis protein